MALPFPGNYDRNDAQYALAIQFGDYDKALRFAIRALRRERNSETWKLRVRGCFRRRHVRRA